MRLIRVLFILLFLSFSGFAQKKIDKAIRTLNKGSVSYIQIKDAILRKDVVFLDTRKKEEFKVSHIKNAIWVGYDNFDAAALKQAIPYQNTQIIVYCSIGVRSEDIGEKLMKLGYNQVKNLYGGIFRWKNQGYPVYDTKGNATDKVHAFDKHWGKLLTKGEKVYR